MLNYLIVCLNEGRTYMQVKTNMGKKNIFNIIIVYVYVTKVTFLKILIEYFHHNVSYQRIFEFVFENDKIVHHYKY